MNLIVGSGLAAVRAAAAMRDAGFEDEILILGAESERPYHRPPLSKEYLAGAAVDEDTFVERSNFYRDRRVDLRLGVVARRLDPQARAVELVDRTRVHYDRILIATGARPRTLDVPGADLGNIFYLRTLADARRLAAALQRVSHVVVVGAGFVGLEVAATARSLGKEVTLLEGRRGPMSRLVAGGAARRAVHELLVDHGVRVVAGGGVLSFRGDGDVAEVLLGSGEAIRAALVVVAIGVQSNVEWLVGSGLLLVDDGVQVDERAATNLPGVFAAGDVARTLSTRFGRALRIEQEGHAHLQGIVAGRCMAGVEASYRPTPAASTSLFGARLQMLGVPEPSHRLVVQGDVARRSFVAIGIDERNCVASVFGMNRPREVLALRCQLELDQPASTRLEATG